MTSSTSTDARSKDWVKPVCFAVVPVAVCATFVIVVSQTDGLEKVKALPAVLTAVGGIVAHIE